MKASRILLWSLFGLLLITGCDPTPIQVHSNGAPVITGDAATDKSLADQMRPHVRKLTPTQREKVAHMPAEDAYRVLFEGAPVP